MNWRPLVIGAVVLFAFAANIVLCAIEVVEPPSEQAKVTSAVHDPLLQKPFSARTRRQNFKSYGMTPDQVDDTERQAKYIFDQRGELITTLLDEHADDAVQVFCPGKISERYRALSVLVVDKDGTLEVLEAGKVRAFTPQPWFKPDVVGQVYDKLERQKEHHGDATVMGVSAILLQQEPAVFNEASPWGSGLLSGWSYKKMLRENADMDGMLTRYFALMHVITEIAHRPEGICE